MNQIEPHRLWVGNAGDGRAFQQLFARDIRAVVDLAAEEAPAAAPRELVYCRFPLLDGGGNEADVLRLAIMTVAQLVQRGVPTLVCCGAGMSRAPAIAAAALSVGGGERLEDCLKRVIESHSADVSPGLWEQINESVKGVKSMKV